MFCSGRTAHSRPKARSRSARRSVRAKSSHMGVVGACNVYKHSAFICDPGMRLCASVCLDPRTTRLWSRLVHVQVHELERKHERTQAHWRTSTSRRNSSCTKQRTRLTSQIWDSPTWRNCLFPEPSNASHCGHEQPEVLGLFMRARRPHCICLSTHPQPLRVTCLRCSKMRASFPWESLPRRTC